MSVAFYSPDEEEMKRHSAPPVDINEGSKGEAMGGVEEEYEVGGTAVWINEHGFKRVALQFPDDLLHVSVAVARALQMQTSAVVVILADTNYGSCCVDEIAAEHYGVDSLVHFGHACLSPVRRLPIRYVFGRRAIDTQSCSDRVKEALRAGGDPGQCVLLLYDVIYHHSIGLLADKLREHFPGLLVPSLVLPLVVPAPRPFDADATSQRLRDSSSETPDISPPPATGVTTLVRFNRRFVVTGGRSLDDCRVLYVGPDSLFLSALMMTFNRCRFTTLDPASGCIKSDAWNVNRLLMKRYYMVEKVRDAARIGILVGTLGVTDYLAVIRRLTDVVRRAGKKCYRFVVGKINVAKLANFAEIDVFVLVACPENSLVDSSEMFRPIVTPYELELACQPGRQWTGDYEVDFRQLLPGGESYFDPSSEQLDDEPRVDVSLVTGKMRQIGVDRAEGQDTSARSNNAGALLQTDGRVVAHNSAGDFLLGRSWQGLDPRLGETPVVRAVEGTRGIARGYQHEPAQRGRPDMKLTAAEGAVVDRGATASEVVKTDSDSPNAGDNDGTLDKGTTDKDALDKSTVDDISALISAV